LKNFIVNEEEEDGGLEEEEMLALPKGVKRITRITVETPSSPTTTTHIKREKKKNARRLINWPTLDNELLIKKGIHDTVVKALRELGEVAYEMEEENWTEESYDADCQLLHHLYEVADLRKLLDGEDKAFSGFTKVLKTVSAKRKKLRDTIASENSMTDVRRFVAKSAGGMAQAKLLAMD
jgi:hypothetical protein